MIKIQFLRPGKWVDNQALPAFDVEKGDVVEVSTRTANFAVKGGAAEYYAEPKSADEAGPESKDDEAGPVKKAEGKPEDAPKRRGRPSKSKDSAE